MIETLDNMKGNYNFTDKYMANEYGEVFFNKPSVYHPCVKKGSKVKHFINKHGYTEYILTDINGNKKHIQAHRIVASLFIENPLNKHYVNHIDGNKTNNHISNLEWCTASENEKHSYHVLKKQVWNKGISLPSGKEYKGKIRTVQRLSINGEIEHTYFNPKEAEQDGYNLKQISAVCNGNQKTHKGKKWKYLENYQENLE